MLAHRAGKTDILKLILWSYFFGVVADSHTNYIKMYNFQNNCFKLYSEDKQTATHIHKSMRISKKQAKSNILKIMQKNIRC